MRDSRTGAWFLSVALLTVALPGVAHAQDRSGTVEISPFGGAAFGGRLYAGSNRVFDRDVDVRSAGTYGIRVGVNANRWLGLEASFATARADIQGRNSGSGLFGRGNKLGTLDTKNYDLNGIFNLGRRRVIPYIALGAGATTFKALVPGVDVDKDTRFSANFGVGVKVFFNPHVALRFDGRGRSSYVNDRDRNRCSTAREHDSCDGDRTDDDRRRWYSSGELTGGITAAF